MKELSTKRPVCASFYCYTCVHSLDHLHVRRGHFEYGRTLAQAFAKLSPRPTAFVAVNDETAVGAQLEFQALGLRVPEDLSVVGFNNQNFCQMVRPQLTSVDQQIEPTVRAAAEIVLAALSRPLPRTPPLCLIEPVLVVRGSTGRVAKR
ncbi:MAG: hypothetical protein RL077_5634 [Verrucomicrobiota bacterium]|jgi:DNA-binding LacI/PurR family transcriptional regulator